MDRRFFLAIVLIVGVVILVPRAYMRIFPPPPGAFPADTAGAARGDSLAAPAAPAAVTGRDTGRAALPATPVAGAAPAAAPGVDTTAPPPAAPAETTVVRTPLATYAFASYGATPAAATLTGYESLRERGRGVSLTPSGTPLASYRLVAAGDTIDLRRVPFRLLDTPAAGADSAPRTLVYEGSAAGAVVRIEYRVDPDSYVIHARGSVRGLPNAALLVDLPTTIRSEEADTAADHGLLAYATRTTSGEIVNVPFRDLAKLDPGERRIEAGPISWIAARNKYFLVAALADSTATPFAAAIMRGEPTSAKTPTTAHAAALMPLADGTFALELYAGPQEWRRLVALGRDFHDVNAYGWSFVQPIVQPFATIVMQILLWMHDKLALGYGWVLVIFGVAVRLLLWPLNQSAMRTSLRMQRIQPELMAIQTKHKGDPKKAHEEMMKIYQAHGVSPFSAFSGCLPMLIPMPVLFALFFVFQNTIEFRGVSFLWLPDISLHDPFYILPILMGLSMFALSWIGLQSTPNNPQAKVMSYVFPPMMTLIFWRFAAGLNLYYFVQNVAALPQQWLIAKERAKAQPAAPVKRAPSPAPSAARPGRR
ncbi:MAG TPA: membrane protein insertase YidC [Gemmatimonadaceae bacterium]